MKRSGGGGVTEPRIDEVSPSAEAGVFRPPDRLERLPGYPLADVPETVAALQRAGRSVLDLGAGDPGLQVPGVAVDALREAASDPRRHGYAFQRGLPAFRRAVTDWMERRYGVAPDPDHELLPLLGSKEGIAHLALAVLDPGDGVLVPDPSYAAYLGGSLFAGARVERVKLEAGNGFRVPPERVLAADGPLRLVYLNYPNNPTGATVDRGYLAEMVRACRERGAVLAHDNPYAELCFDGYRAPSLLEVPGGSEGGVEFHSFSKSFNMTGWRLGWAAGDADVLRALARVKSYFDTGVFLAVQAAGAAVLDGAEPFLEKQRATVAARRNAAVEAFRAAGFRVETPRATLYLWLPVPTDESSAAFASRALSTEGVILLPGSALGDGGEGYVRAALTLDPDRYDEAANRLARLV